MPGGNVTQWVECLSSIHEDPGLVLLCINLALCLMLVILWHKVKYIRCSRSSSVTKPIVGQSRKHESLIQNPHRKQNNRKQSWTILANVLLLMTVHISSKNTHLPLPFRSKVLMFWEKCFYPGIISIQHTKADLSLCMLWKYFVNIG